MYDGDEIAPIKGAYVPEIVSFIRDRYGFVRSSDIIESRQNITFEQGRLVRERDHINIAELILYEDGASVTTKDSDLSIEVLADLADAGSRALGWRVQNSQPHYIYQNNAVVEFDVRVSVALSIYDEFKSLLEKSMSEVYEQDASMHLLGFGFAIDPDTPGRISKKEFTMIRRVGHPYSGSRFLCTAPLPTKLHHHCLRELENSLRSVGG